MNPEIRERLWRSTVPPGRLYFYLVSRHFVPGYFHLVPPGQDPPFRCKIFLKLALMGLKPWAVLWSPPGEDRRLLLSMRMPRLHCLTNDYFGQQCCTVRPETCQPSPQAGKGPSHSATPDFFTCYVRARRKWFNAITTRRIAPQVAIAKKGSTPSRFRPLAIICNMITANTTPSTLPKPPLALVPPSTAARTVINR